MKETRVGLIAVVVMYLVFSVVGVVVFWEQTWVWQLEVGLIKLIGVLFLGFVVYAIDKLLDKKYPFERNVYKRIFLQFIIMFLILAFFRLATYKWLVGIMPFRMSRELLLVSWVLNLFTVLSITLFIFGSHFFKRWKEEKIIAAELEKEKALVQYDNLKNQLNPHFLFNSLSSLNSLIFVNPQLASDFLLQLSKVYRYVLDNKEKNLVTVETELNFVKHYAQLLKARFEEGLDILFEVDESALQKTIVPVTLQILFENAIKHNITQKDAPLKIRVYNDSRNLIVENNLQKKKIVDGSNGQGLENLKNLYRYLTDYEVIVEENDKLFIVKMPLLGL